MDTQSFDASRLTQQYSDSDCRGDMCPTCDCDGRNVNDTWFVEYQNYWFRWQNFAICAKCECLADYYSGESYAYCEDYSNYYAVGSQSCPAQDKVYSCHRDWHNSSGITLLYSFVFK